MNSKGQHVLCATHMLSRAIIAHNEDLHSSAR